MKSRKIISLLIRIGGVLIITVIIIIGLQYQEDKNYEMQGEELIDKIETFRHRHNRLPNSYLELGLVEPMDEGPYFEKVDSINYKVFFHIGFDDIKIYFSKNKEWIDEP